MIKVLLADDEPLCLIGMQGMLNWNELGFEVVGAVRNGADAWESVQSLRPDIVITDLKMPVMGGLELAEKCREEDPALPVFIMLTNYEEFDYVKQSMRLGAVEYLVKIDLTAEGLTSALRRAREQVEKERILRAPQDRAADSLGQYRDLLFLRLYSGLYETKESFQAQADSLGLRFDAPWYAVAYAALEAREMTIEQAATLCSGMAGMAADILPKYLPGTCVTRMDLDHFTALIPLQDAGEAEEHQRHVLEQAAAILFQYFSTRLQWAVSLPVPDILEVKQALRSASSLLTQMKPEHMVRFCRAPMTPLDYRVQLVTRIRDYISRNLGQRLTLNEVAAEFNFSPSYLSQLLSRDGEAGFVEFVTATRISTAKELMATTDLRVYEISDQVGFESASYFSKVFKRLEGVSPREYMQKLRED